MIEVLLRIEERLWTRLVQLHPELLQASAECAPATDDNQADQAYAWDDPQELADFFPEGGSCR